MPKPERQVLVCVNSRPPGNPKGSCGEKGGQALFDRLKEILRERGLEGRVMVNRTYCLKHCSRGPVVAVQPDNVWYAGRRRGGPRGDLRLAPRGRDARRAPPDARHPLGVTRLPG